jgi:ABC-type multidrug transport system fused ATPase/permease subunit
VESRTRLVLAWLHEEIADQKRNVVRVLFCKVVVAFHDAVSMTLIPTFIVDWGVGKYGNFETSQFLTVFYLVLAFTISNSLARQCNRAAKELMGVSGMKTKLRKKLMNKFNTLSPSWMERESRYDKPGWVMVLVREIEILVDVVWVGFFFKVSQLCLRLAFTIFVIFAVSTDYFTRLPNVRPLVGLGFVVPVHYAIYKLRATGYRDLAKFDTDGMEKIGYQAQVLFEHGNLKHHFFPETAAMDLRVLNLVDVLGAHAKAKKLMAFHLFDSEYLLENVDSCLLFLWLVFGGFLLIESEHYGNSSLTVGAFFAVLKCYSNVISACTKISLAELGLIRGAESIMRLQHCFNSGVTSAIHHAEVWEAQWIR